MIAPMLKIGAVEIALQTFPVVQEYRPVTGETLHRMANGAAFKQQHWRKVGISISGDGWAPPALAGVDWALPVEISCVTPMAIGSNTTAATLPAARRGDISPSVYAVAVVNGEVVNTPVSVVGNVATATAVSGASSYQFWYYPKLTCYSGGPTEALNVPGASFTWSLEAEEA
jgi:hypothetical protein